MGKAHEIGSSRVETLTFHTFHHVQCNALFQTHAFSVVHVQKTVTYNLLKFSHGRPS